MNSITGKISIVVAVVALAGAAYTLGASGLPVKQTVAAAPVLYSADTVSSVYSSASPAVFEIDVTDGAGNSNRFMQAQGTGFLVDNQGHILTNNHVVDGATSVKVLLDNGNTVDATVAGTDSLDDLAVITVDPAAVKDITPLQLADSGAVKPGQMAIAIGTPFGLTDTVTVGIISGLNRSVNGSSLTGMFQTDAAINPGNSGGPLLDVNGAVIGINTAVEGNGADGIGFAIPANVAKKALPDLIAGKQVTRPWLGIAGTALSQTLSTTLNLSVNQGVYVVSVTPGSPAEAAGLKAGGTGTAGTPGTGGDVVTAADGKSVKTVQELSSYFNTKRVGDTVTLSIVRDGNPMDVKATLGPWPAAATPVPNNTPLPKIPGHGFGRVPSN